MSVKYETICLMAGEQCKWRDFPPRNKEDCFLDRVEGYPLCEKHLDIVLSTARMLAPGNCASAAQPYVEQFVSGLLKGAGATVGAGVVVALFTHWRTIVRFLANAPWLDFGGGPPPMREWVVEFDDAVVALMEQLPEHRELIRNSMIGALRTINIGYDVYDWMQEDYAAFKRW